MESRDLNLMAPSLLFRKMLILSDLPYIFERTLARQKYSFFWLLHLDSLEDSLNIRKMFFFCVTDHFKSFRFWQNLWHSEKICYDVITHLNDVIMKDLGYHVICLIVIYCCAKLHVFSI